MASFVENVSLVLKYQKPFFLCVFARVKYITCHVHQSCQTLIANFFFLF